MNITNFASDLTDLPSASGIVQGVTIRCDWVNRLRESGAENAFNEFLGNALGFVQAFAGYFVVIAVVIALVTLFIGKRYNSSWLTKTLWAIVVLIILVPVLGFASTFGNGGC